MNWVCLAANRKVWKAPLNTVSLFSSMCVANGASVTGIFEKKLSETLEVAVK